MKDEEYMKLALSLAARGSGFTNPNPMVGAVLVKGGQVIGQGWHEYYGGLHAERNAIKNSTAPPTGGTLYVTLEPCCHQGKTPPCTEAIIKNGITRVVIGSHDPNPLVCGKGVRELEAHGIEVTTEILKDECDRLNVPFFHYIRTQTPYVIMKYAMTLDGKIATSSGKSRWVTGELARMRVQQDRHHCQGIMAGVGTVIADNPMLTCRISGSCSPVRIICDTGLRTPLNSKVITTAGEYRTIIATCCNERAQHAPFIQAGCTVLVTSAKNGHVNLNDLMVQLGELHIASILLEGGGTLNWSALKAGIVNRIQAYIAPKLFGGTDARMPVEGAGVCSPDDAFSLSNVTVTQVGEDVLMEGDVSYVHRNN